MRTLGIIGGMSWESTAQYYALINRGVRDRLGGLHSAPLIISSCDFAPIEELQMVGKWDELAEVLKNTARKLEGAGAEGVLIATNTMHIVVDEVRANASIPVLSLLEVVGEAVLTQGMKTVGLLGTRFTMEHGFYQSALNAKGIEVLTPDDTERALVNDVIYNELVKGIIRDESRERFVEIVDDLAGRGVEGAIMGCTEIPLLIGQGDVGIPLLDTTILHAEAALQHALES